MLSLKLIADLKTNLTKFYQPSFRRILLYKKKLTDSFIKNSLYIALFILQIAKKAEICEKSLKLFKCDKSFLRLLTSVPFLSEESRLNLCREGIYVSCFSPPLTRDRT